MMVVSVRVAVTMTVLMIFAMVMMMTAVVVRVTVVRRHASFVPRPGFFCQSPRHVLEVPS